MQDLVGVVFVPEGGFVHVPEVLGKLQIAPFVVARHIERIGQQADHHALVGLRRMPGNDDVMVAVNVAIHVGNRQLGFVDGGFKCHGNFLCVSRS